MAAPLQGAAIFSSFDVESLEQRTHFSATLLSEYFPLIRSSTWTYKVVEDGRRSTRTDTVMGRMTRVHGESAFTLRHQYSDRADNFDFDNYTSSGQIQWHRLGDVGFSPQLILPRLAKAGQQTHAEGIAGVSAAYRPNGPYKVDFKILKAERIEVPAGTFSCIKIRMNLDLNVSHHDSQADFSIHIVSSATSWWAKGVGIVKEVAISGVTMNENPQVKTSVTTTTLSSYHIAEVRR